MCLSCFLSPILVGGCCACLQLCEASSIKSLKLGRLPERARIIIIIIIIVLLNTGTRLNVGAECEDGAQHLVLALLQWALCVNSYGYCEHPLCGAGGIQLTSDIVMTLYIQYLHTNIKIISGKRFVWILSYHVISYHIIL